MSEMIGRTLGQYEITELIGSGGMSTVYKAYQASVGRDVAVKVLPPHPGLNDQLKERFRLEARTIGGLQNPHILPLYDYGTDGDILYLVMAYATGGTLDGLMHDGPMRPELVEKYVQQIASALDYAHRRDIVHRDVKPNNILLDDDGNVLLADFGIVKMLSQSTGLTGTAIVGTPAYMSPEQGQGLDIDGRSDIYSLAIMVYEMLTGKQPYSGGTPMQVILKHIREPVPDIRKDLPGAPDELVRVLEKALAKNPQYRYQSAVAFADAFSDAINNNQSQVIGAQAAGRQRPAQHSASETVQLTATEPPGSDAFKQPINDSTNPPAQTTIIREGPSPIILLGGFAIIAVLVVIVASFVFNQQQPPEVAINPTPTEETAAATDAPTQVVDVPPDEQTSGTVSYTSAESLGDTVRVTLSNSSTPPSGSRYVAWLVNTTTDETLRLGNIVRDAFGEGSITYTDPDGALLPVLYNSVVISAESETGDTISGDVFYRSEVPIAIADALREIFVASEDGINGGSLYDGLQREAGTAQQHAGLAARATTIGGVRNHAEHTINILSGTQDDYDGDGRPQNPGRGIGVFFFLEQIESALQEALNSESATVDLQVNAEFIRVCGQNVHRWAEQVIDLEIAMIESETVEDAQSPAAESTKLMEHIINGFDANDNGSIEPFEGECGLAQIPDYGVVLSSASLTEVE